LYFSGRCSVVWDSKRMRGENEKGCKGWREVSVMSDEDR